ncbi:MAG: T9SS type A sorting domain-containing protein [Paludibacter sp.]
MKKLLLFIFVIACVTISKGNPIVAPSVAISELAFESNGNWVIELQGFDLNPNIQIDSIFLESSTGISKLKRFTFDGISNIILVRNDSLLSNLTINLAGDSLKLHYYYNSFDFSMHKPALVYGNFKTAQFYSPGTSQTLAGISGFQYSTKYSIDKSPTIGLENDTVGMCGTIKGNIYDKNNQLVSGNDYTFYGTDDLHFNSTPDGSYSSRIYSYKNHISNLSVYYRPKTKWSNVEIIPVDVSIQPDTVVNVDIHLISYVIDGIDKVKMSEESLLRISPNPIKDLAFKYEISIPVKSSTSYIELISLSGQKIGQFPVTENTGKINLPANTANGMYSLRLFVNNKNYATAKIIIAGE